MCEEESEDSEAVGKLLEINDSIHRTVERYKLMKAGNVSEANNIPKGTLGTTTGVGRNAKNELSLIDFEPDEPDETPTTSAANGSNTQTSIEEDLLSLSLGNKSQAPTSAGGISLGGTTLSNLYAQSSTPQQSFSQIQQPLPPMPGMSSMASPPPTMSPKPNFDLFASIQSTPSTSKPATPNPIQQQSRPAVQNIDPFAALVSSSSRPTTPSHQQQNGNRSAFAALQPSSLAAFSTPQTPPRAQSNIAPADDEWQFSSALPPESVTNPALPQTSVIVVHQKSLKVEFESRRSSQPGADNAIYIQAYFSNLTSVAITGLHFQVAAEKSYSLQLRPQSGRDLPPSSNRGVRQELLLSGVPIGKGDSAKMRFKIGYVLNGQPMEEQGTVPSLGIS